LGWLLVAVCAAVIPQLTGRTDLVHALYTVGPGLIAWGALIELVASRIGVGALAPVAVLAGASLLINPIATALWPFPGSVRSPADAAAMIDLPHTRGIAEPRTNWTADRRVLIALISRLTDPSDAVYFGTETHERVMVNETDLYFLARRLPGTRYSQFDPNIVTRRDVQEEMIRQLEQRNVSLVVLSPCCLWDEGPQQKILPGAGLLDEYIASHYAEIEKVGQYSVKVRRPDVGPR
jgi:hypothetical protein